MDSTKWSRQTPTEPLFPDMLWSRPENRRHAGKLLIIGGNSAGFAAPSQAFTAAEKAGAGSVRVILPQSLERMLAKMFPESEFLPATPSGSFARPSLGPICDASAWADGVLLAGDFGKNSETAITLEGFVNKYSGKLIVAGDALDYFLNEPGLLLDRPDTILVAQFSKLQKLLSGRLLLQHSMNLAQIIEQLTIFSASCGSSLVSVHAGQILVASEGNASTTNDGDTDLTELAAYLSVWFMQQPNKPFEALTTAAYCYVS